MASVDDRIVAMKFDNASFQEKVSSTIASLDKLKGSLDFANANKGMNDLTLSSRNFSLEGIASAVEGIGSKFTAMGAVAFSVIDSVVSRAVTAGVQLGKSLSLDQVISGFHEYETNMNSIQTVLANTKRDGTTLNDVNAALDQLNQYSDKTIYNFSQMAKNVGTFTAAGVDLNTSVSSIKGIANLAAISGSSADQASTAMYQLSQAIASGTVRLMDWNSVTNAGIGGAEFQRALFETAKTFGTIKDLPVGATFEDWQKKAGNFRTTLDQGWLTSEVLTQTLSNFTGDLTVAQLQSKGFSEQQITDIQAMGSTAIDAASKVKTLTQLISTVKESIGSGWGLTFRTIFGDFEQARTTFTQINDTISGMVQKSAAARNQLLKSWSEVGGRDLLFKGLMEGFQGVLAILAPIKAAFRDIFPAQTFASLFLLTKHFEKLMASLTPSPAVVVLITRIFRGLFAAFSIGIDVVKGLFHFVKRLIDEFSDNDPNTGIVGFVARIADKIVWLKKVLDRSNGITDFFDYLADAIHNAVYKAVYNLQPFIDKVLEVKDTIANFFTGGGASSTFEQGTGVVGDAIQRIGDRFGFLGTILSHVWDWFQSLADKFPSFIGAFSGIDDFIREHFSNIPKKIAESFSGVDYGQALDTLNTGFFAGLVLLIRKFINGNLNFGGGIMKNISQSFSTLTSTLQTMQTNIKANILLKIAGALAILTASLVVLSLMDSDALTRSLTAMAVGFGQLVVAMSLLDKVVNGPTQAAQLAILAAGILVLSGAMLVMAVAAKVFATMNWEELSRGISAVTVLLAALTIASKNLDAGGMVRSGIGIMAIAVAMNILAIAMKIFATMSWEEIAKGLVSVGVGLGVIAKTMQMMPKLTAINIGAGLLLVGIALNAIALAMKIFATMSWQEIGKGMTGVAGGLLIIALAMDAMPFDMPLIGAGLILVGIGLISVAKAMASMGSLSWSVIGKGLVGIAGALLVLALGMAAMEGAIPGALAIFVASKALGTLVEVIITLSGISWGELLKGLGALVLILGTLSIAALLMEPAAGALLVLGAALLVVGAGMALFGLGANLVATAFAIIATAGTQGIATLASALDLLIEKLPAIIAALADGLLELGQKILEAAPELIAKLDVALQALIQLVIDNIPGFVTAGVALIRGLLDAIVQLAPDFIEAGAKMLLDLLHGIADHISEIVTTVVDIITNFLQAITDRLPDVIAKGVELILTFLQGIANHIGDVIAKGAEILASFLEGIANNIGTVISAAADVVIHLITGISDNMWRIINTGVTVVENFLIGLRQNIIKLVQAGWDFIINLINGIADSIDQNMPKLRQAGLHLALAIIDGFTGGLTSKAADIANTVKDVLVDKPLKVLNGIKGWILGSPSKLTRKMGGWIAQGLAIGLDQDTTAESSAESFANRVTTNMQNALAQANFALSDIVTTDPVIRPVLDLGDVQMKAKTINAMLASTIPFQADISTDQANAISIATTALVDQPTQTDINAQNKLAEVTYNQYNYSPEALSSADIFRQTHNLITLHKEELANK